MADSTPLLGGGRPSGDSVGDVGRLARALDVKAGQLAWLLGAGASAMSGIPTAGSLILRFKHELYCDRFQLDVQDVDPAESFIRQRIESYFDNAEGFPPMGAPEEYSVAFERAYPDPDVRADLIKQLCREGRPNYGHWVLAALMATHRLQLAFTTNFDSLIEDSARIMFEDADITPRPDLNVASLGEPDKALRALQRSSFPLIAKLHGDFQSVLLKNTRGELEAQDEKMRSALQQACSRFGFVAVGYSGRDASVMNVLTEAAARADTFPSGLYWCHRPSEKLAPSVLELLAAVRDRGRTALSVEVDSFVELASAIERSVRLPGAVTRCLAERRLPPQLAEAPMPAGPTRQYPILRLNALPLQSMPTEARRLEQARPCDLSEAQAALRGNRARALIARQSGGRLVAFGDDEQLASTLTPLGITVTSSTEHMDWAAPIVDPADTGLALDAITIGLGRTPGLRHVLTRRAHQVRVSEPTSGALSRLQSACGGRLLGSVPMTDLQWAEAVTLTLDRRNDRWWLLLEPDIWISPQPKGIEGARHRHETRAASAAFVQSRQAARYNRTANTILDEWARLLCGGRGTRNVRTWNLDSAAGIDPTFEIDGHTAYSRPLAGEPLRNASSQ